MADYFPGTQKRTLLKSWVFILPIVYISIFAISAALAPVLPLGFQPEQLDLGNGYLPPFQWTTYQTNKPFHWLGTDKVGRDLLANLVYGCRTALLVSVPAMGIALFLGMLLGSIAGYYGDKSLKVSFISIVIVSIFIFLSFYYGFYIRQIALGDSFANNAGLFQLLISLGICLIIMAVCFLLLKNVSRFRSDSTDLYLPIDQLILKLIELLSSIPRIIFILCLAAFAKPSLWNIILITGFTYWTEPARLIRAELLRIRNMNYIESAKALGLGDFYILVRHALPNALPSIIVTFTFGLVSLISLESTLSFLGIGLPTDVASWGRMVMGIRSDFSAWWLVLFPSLLLITTVLSLQACSQFLIRKIDPKSR